MTKSPGRFHNRTLMEAPNHITGRNNCRTGEGWRAPECCLFMVRPSVRYNTSLERLQRTFTRKM